MDKYQNKYRIPSARAQWWDYGWNGGYFITICTRNREHFFGKIVDGKMVLSETGNIADLFWNQIPNHSPFVVLGESVVMPNHIHGILILDKPNDGNGISVNDNRNDNGNDNRNDNRNGNGKDNRNGNGNDNYIGNGNGNDNGNDNGTVETGHARSLPQISPLQTMIIGQNRFQHIGSNTISSIIGSYKSAVTKQANRLGLDNGWQNRFHDRIIRDFRAYQKISEYIINNPKNWKNDIF